MSEIKFTEEDYVMLNCNCDRNIIIGGGKCGVHNKSWEGLNIKDVRDLVERVKALEEKING